MKAGGLRHRVTIQKNETSRSPSGQPIEAWVDKATVWAEVKAISGRELLASGAELAEATVRVWMRYVPDITPADRLRFKMPGQEVLVYDITSVIPDGIASRVELLCKGGVKQ